MNEGEKKKSRSRMTTVPVFQQTATDGTGEG